MKAFIVGGDSKIAQVLAQRLMDKGHEVVCTSRRPDADGAHLDLLDPVLPRWPGSTIGVSAVVYIMAAITGIVPAEMHPDAWRVNAEGALSIAVQAHARGWHVVFPSSGTVEKAPHTASAHQKSYVEGHVLAMGGSIVRPLPFVRPEWYPELADVFIDVGETRRAGVVRWDKVG